MKSRKNLSVGSLLGVPQSSPPMTPAAAQPEQRSRLRPAPPADKNRSRQAPYRRGRGCCQSGCSGCPWTRKQRARMLESKPPESAGPLFDGLEG